MTFNLPTLPTQVLAVVFSALLGLLAPPAYSQSEGVNPEIANCEEIRDPATQTQVDFCTAHIGCKLVIGIQKACTKVKTFLNKLKNFSFGKDKLDSNDVFEAAAPSADGDVAFNNISNSIKSSYEKQPKKEIVSGKFESGVNWVYEGAMKNGKRDGSGVLITDSGTIFRGDFVEGQQAGLGEMVNDKSRKAGVMVNAKMDGSGVERFADGKRYEGEYKADKYDGKGVLTQANGSRWEASFKDGMLNGQGVFTNAKGDRYEGNFVNDLRSGQGTYRWADGEQYTGNWADGVKQGRGTYIWPSGTRFDGEYQNNKKFSGIETYPDGRQLMFVNGITEKSPRQIADEIGGKYDQRINTARNECAASQKNCESGCNAKGAVGLLSMVITKGQVGSDSGQQMQECSNSCGSEKSRCDEQVDRLVQEKRQAIAAATAPKAPPKTINAGASSASGTGSGSASNSGRICDGQCGLLIAETKCKHLKNNVEQVGCLASNGAGSSDTPTLCAQARSISGCVMKADYVRPKLVVTKSTYDSVCARNFKKIENIMYENNISQAGATYDLFLRDINRYTAKIFEPCMASDPDAARNYKASMEQYEKINQYCAGTHPAYTCTQWGANGGVSDNGGSPYNNIKFYQNWKAEVDKALSNPNYSEELGPIKGGGGGVGDTAEATCADSLKTIERQYDSASRKIPANSIVVLSEANMWRISKSIEKVKAQCPQSRRYTTEMESLQKTYHDIKRACDASASAPPCMPRLPG